MSTVNILGKLLSNIGNPKGGAHYLYASVVWGIIIYDASIWCHQDHKRVPHYCSQNSVLMETAVEAINRGLLRSGM